MKVKTGIDELILWIRKNKIAATIPNDEINGLDINIYRIIQNLVGIKIGNNQFYYCPINQSDSAIGKYKLP